MPKGIYKRKNGKSKHRKTREDVVNKASLRDSQPPLPPNRAEAPVALSTGYDEAFAKGQRRGRQQAFGSILQMLAELLKDGYY